MQGVKTDLRTLSTSHKEIQVKRYRTGWWIPRQVMGLTHFDPVVTPQDFAGILADASACIQEAERPFHALIDNRGLNNLQITPLRNMIQAFPALRHPLLQNIVVVLPAGISSQAGAIPKEQEGHLLLHHVEDLEAAIRLLKALDDGIDWDVQNQHFFLPED